MAFRQMSYWHRNLLIIASLLVLWFIATFVPVYFAVALSRLFLFGWPFSFWMAAFGAPAVFVLIIGLYAWYMNREDERLRQEERLRQKKPD